MHCVSMKVTSQVRFLYKANCNPFAIGNNGEHFRTPLGDHFKQSSSHKNNKDCALNRAPPQGCVRVWELARDGSTWCVHISVEGGAPVTLAKCFHCIWKKCLWVENTGVEKFNKSSKWQRQNQLIMGPTAFWPQVSMWQSPFHLIPTVWATSMTLENLVQWSVLEPAISNFPLRQILFETLGSLMSS